MIFLSNYAYTTFSFWTENWKTLVQTKIWNHPHYLSSAWCEPLLIGDLDASRAFLVSYKYSLHLSDIGIDLIVNWIEKNKENWENDPPLWYTNDWKQKLPKRVNRICYHNN